MHNLSTQMRVVSVYMSAEIFGEYAFGAMVFVLNFDYLKIIKFWKRKESNIEKSVTFRSSITVSTSPFWWKVTSRTSLSSGCRVRPSPAQSNRPSRNACFNNRPNECARLKYRFKLLFFAHCSWSTFKRTFFHGRMLKIALYFFFFTKWFQCTISIK